LTEFNDLHEVQTMLSETVKKWTMEWEHQGVIKGRQEEAARLFLLLLDARFGGLSLDAKEKIRQASPEQIEAWTKQIFQAETPEALLNS